MNCLPSLFDRRHNRTLTAGLIHFFASLVLLSPVCRGADAGAEPRSEEFALPESRPPKFELDIQPILTAHGCNAGACHGKARGQNGFSLSLLGFDSDFDYRSIVSDARGRRIFPSSPVHSLLLTKSSGELPHGGGVRLPVDSDAYQTVIDWIHAGMPRVDSSDPAFQRIEILPAPHPLLAGQTEALTVVAHYSDGTTRDVTQTSFYQSNEPAIVAVEPNGRLTAGDLPGEATIMARFMGQISTWSTAIPRPEAIEEARYASLPSHNFIDELVWQKLRRLNIFPSELITDEKFLRRACLDLIGRLPTSSEVRDFHSDTEADKRERLVDRLLDRPEYADFWANKWADLLRPNPYRVGIKATLSLDGWLKDAFRENMPYDDFVRGLVTAKGSTWRNGATSVFRDRRTPEELTTMFSQLFLGVRLDCAKCHQHPFEIYSQKDFFSLAAYFGRVGFKGTGLSPPISGGEEIVMVASQGGVTHPITGELLPPDPLWGSFRDVQAEDDPRDVLVDWMVSAENERFSQAAANRIWGELFGVGIVDPVDDIRATNPPSNPALLAALGDEFRRSGFDQKQLLRTITRSATYSLSSIPNPTNAGDPLNFSRHYRRLSRAELLADAVSDITGIPDQFDGMPGQSRSMQLWTFRTHSEFLDAFGRPDPNQDPPCERLPQATMGQALHLMNAPAIQAKLSSDDGLPARLAASAMTTEEKIDEVYLNVYSRFPTFDERAALEPLFADASQTQRKILEDILWSLLNTPEFIYED